MHMMALYTDASEVLLLACGPRREWVFVDVRVNPSIGHTRGAHAHALVIELSICPARGDKVLIAGRRLVECDKIFRTPHRYVAPETSPRRWANHPAVSAVVVIDTFPLPASLHSAH